MNCKQLLASVPILLFFSLTKKYTNSERNSLRFASGCAAMVIIRLLRWPCKYIRFQSFPPPVNPPSIFIFHVAAKMHLPCERASPWVSESYSSSSRDGIGCRKEQKNGKKERKLETTALANDYLTARSFGASKSARWLFKYRIPSRIYGFSSFLPVLFSRFR